MFAEMDYISRCKLLLLKRERQGTVFSTTALRIKNNVQGKGNQDIYSVPK